MNSDNMTYDEGKAQLVAAFERITEQLTELAEAFGIAWREATANLAECVDAVAKVFEEWDLEMGRLSPLNPERCDYLRMMERERPFHLEERWWRLPRG